MAVMFHTAVLNAQWNDAFTNGSLNNWTGDIEDFIINEQGQLQLDAQEPGASSIFRKYNTEDSLEWRFDVQLNFSPSSNNKLIIQLAGDTTSELANSYYRLEIGQNGQQDAIQFITSINGLDSLVASGTSGLVSEKFKFSFRIIKTVDQFWKLELFTESGHYLSKEFAIKYDQMDIPEQTYFGIQCKYTSSNRKAFYFDNISVTSLPIDLEGPIVRRVTQESESTLCIELNECAFFESENDIIELHPIRLIDSIYVSSEECNKVYLKLKSALSYCSPTELHIKNIRDSIGNRMTAFNTSLLSAKAPFEKEILINEILSDPIENGSDFIELINIGPNHLKLSDIILYNKYNNRSATIGDVVVEPFGYIVLSNDTLDTINRYGFSTAASYVEISLPALNNDSGHISLILLSDTGDSIYIDSMEYNKDFHNPSLMETEGVSIERISLSANSNSLSNWNSSSGSILKATPGFSNSISEINKTTSSYNSNVIRLCFPTLIEKSAITDISNYDIDKNSIIEVSPTMSDSRCVDLSLLDPLESGAEYTLFIKSMSAHCGASYEENTSIVRKLENAMPGELIVNEILFDPYPGHDDFIEIKNISSKFIRLDNVSFENSTNADYSGVSHELYIKPGEVMAFSQNANMLTDIYSVPDSARLVNLAIPTLNNETGNVKINREIDNGTITLDAFDYSTEMHLNVLHNLEGVSLERINPYDDTNVKHNWTSSAANYNYGSPGVKNSAYNTSNADSQSIELAYKVFSPDSDGYNDILIVNYSMNQHGYIGNFEVFDDLGNPIKSISQNELLGKSGKIIWDGTDRYSRLCQPGIYIIGYELYHYEGHTISGKEICVLAQFLD